MKRSILLLLFCSAFARIYALPELPTKPYSRQDTIVAIQALFADKRSSGKTFTMVGGCYVAASVFALPILGVGGITTGFGIIRQIRFRRHREEVLLNEYQLGNALPKRIQRRLKASHFD
ncbi:hypothetical protein [Spirosoma endbachense]|uniref:Uncharacterized protein n=1 Tax=Spirosoma endbachense TaxID=2666025 RepID=A0A6P1W7Q6_9BACT|nr:hypothetical protein [Spirosoma endbachense]QHW01056.1 hypothetical protein GJR95_41170 [Spirosoma endbachense]